MKKSFMLLLFFISYAAAFACTTFLINKNGQLVFGRNYDLVTGNGMVYSNQRGLAKTSSKTSDGNTIKWISKYGSVTFNQYGKEFPTGGMNEKGLVVEVMWLEETEYPSPDSRPAIAELQWVQYQLDNCSTVSELIATDKNVRIAKGSAPIHFLAADANGNAATIEFINGKMEVHTNNTLPFPVLTNNSYSESLPVTKLTTPVTDNSLLRFSQACSMVQSYSANNISVPIVDYSFSILDKVAQGDHTKWSIVYDITNKKVYFKTSDHPSIKNFLFSSFDFACPQSSRMAELNQDWTGDISSSFINFSSLRNQGLVEKSFLESAAEIHATKEEAQSAWQYPIGISCQK